MKRIACLLIAAATVAGCEAESPRPSMHRGYDRGGRCEAPIVVPYGPYKRHGEIGADPSFEEAEERIALDRRLEHERKEWAKQERQRIREEYDRREAEREEAEAEEIRQEQETSRLRRAASQYEAYALENARRGMERRRMEVEETVRRSDVMFLPREVQKRLLAETGK